MKCRERYGSSKAFLAIFNPDMQCKYCANVKRVFMGTAPSLSLLQKAYGDNVAESWVAIQIRDLSEFSGCQTKLSTEQIDKISKVVVTMFSYLTVTELMYFFLLFKSGKFGKFYGAVDGLVITEALQDFLRIRYNRLSEFENEEREQRMKLEQAEHAKNAMSYDEWQEIKWLFNMGYEPWRIKAELAEQRMQTNK